MTRFLQYLARVFENDFHEFNCYVTVGSFTADGGLLPPTGGVQTTPQMTRFRDVKVCKNLATDEIDDHRIQSDYNMNCNIKKERTLHLVLRLRGEEEHDTNDNVTTTKTHSTFHTKHMNIDT